MDFELNGRLQLDVACSALRQAEVNPDLAMSIEGVVELAELTRGNSPVTFVIESGDDSLVAAKDTIIALSYVALGNGDCAQEATVLLDVLCERHIK